MSVSSTGEDSRPKSVKAAASTPKVPKMTTTTEGGKDKVLDPTNRIPKSNVSDDNSGEKGSPNDKEDEAEENNDDLISKKRK
ncbi:hypothetical protein MKW92_008212, partial [Papaver armeniacum]